MAKIMPTLLMDSPLCGIAAAANVEEQRPLMWINWNMVVRFKYHDSRWDSGVGFHTDNYTFMGCFAKMESQKVFSFKCT